MNASPTVATPRPPKDRELPLLLALNQDALPHVNSLDLEDVTWFSRHCAYFRALFHQGAPLGFLGAMTPDCDYQSPNFLWFRSRFSGFVYIDRVIVAPQAQRRGVASRLYQDLESWARTRAPLVACEVNLQPPNPGSLAFHVRRGFRQVGTQQTDNGAKTVALLLKKLDALG